MNTIVLLLLAVCLDLAVGDPRSWPHPVRLIGAGYAALDRLADRRGWRTRGFGACCVAGMAVTGGGLVGLAGRLPYVGWVVALYFAFAGLALGSLLREGRRAARLLEAGDLEAGRAVVAGLVSRDVSGLDGPGLWRALAESVSENANDGFVAPLFFLALGGPGLLWAYKAVSTADSMWGYKTDRYVRLGWFAARCDDVLAYAPARLTAGAMVLAGRLLGLGRGLCWRDMVRDAKRSASPNAGWPMAAAAWVCGGGMGGPSVYFGELVDKPAMGPRHATWDAWRFWLLGRVVLLASAIVVVITVLVHIAAYAIFGL